MVIIIKAEDAFSTITYNNDITRYRFYCYTEIRITKYSGREEREFKNMKKFATFVKLQQYIWNENSIYYRENYQSHTSFY
jgi:hypothetical protein